VTRGPISPVVREVGTYPFARLDDAKRRVVDRGVALIDFGVGDPREPTASVIREALIGGIRETMEYPKAAGLPELRVAIADWVLRRFGVRLNPDSEIVPTLGSKEAVFSLAQVVVDRPGGKDLVIVTEPGYPVPARGARFAGAEVLSLPLTADRGFLPDFDRVSDDLWPRVALVWVNYPNNPTGALAPLRFYEDLAARAERHGFWIASDEAYSELGFGDAPPVSAPSAAIVPTSWRSTRSANGHR
jgi:aspartate/methionine/tyrosine aminotransferase